MFFHWKPNVCLKVYQTGCQTGPKSNFVTSQNISYRNVFQVILNNFGFGDHLSQRTDRFFTYYRPQTKLRKGNVFTPVCDSVHRGEVTPPGQTPLYPLPETPTAADGTHPAGMHSCYDSLDPAQHFCARNRLTHTHGLTEGTVDQNGCQSWG